MVLDFTGKIVLVTGGGNGIGAASARKFAAAGARVAVIDRDGDGGRAGRGRDRRRRCAAIALDVSDGEAFARLAAEIAAKAGGIDVLVNSAGTITRQTIAAMPVADWDRIIAVNLRGPFNGTQAVIPHMKKRGGGAIVNVASVAGRRISFGGGANYTSSKAGPARLHPARRLRAGARPDPGQRGVPRPDRDRVRRRPGSLGRAEGRRAREKSRSAAWSNPRTSPTQCCSSPATWRACAPASRSMSMAAS